MTRTDDKLFIRFASLLGWDGLERRAIDLPEGDTTPDGRTRIVWYQSGTVDDLLFHINIRPRPHVIVHALRFRLCSGWYCFELYRDPGKLSREADRLADRSARKHFETLEGRRRFRAAHPECTGYSFSKLDRDGTPYPYAPNRTRKRRN